MTNLPSNISICGKKYKIVKIKDSNGGYFNEAKAEIGIGTQYADEVRENLIHEVIEGIFAIRDLRYRLEKAEQTNGDILFSFSHYQFEQACKDISAAFKGLNFK